jgi:hypothetical protein
MGIIKTAMLSGVAIYGVKQITKTAQNRGNYSNHAPPPRRDYSFGLSDRPPPPRPHDLSQGYSSNTRDLSDADIYDYPSQKDQQRQQSPLEDPRQQHQQFPTADQRAYYHNDDYASTSGPSPSAPPQYYSRQADSGYQAGFIEDDEFSYDLRQPQGGSSGG